MNGLWRRPLPVGKTGRYTYTEDAEWLGNATISGAGLTATADSGVTVDLAVTDGAQIEVTLTGVTVGRHKVHMSYAISDGRSHCATGVIDVVEC